MLAEPPFPSAALAVVPSPGVGGRPVVVTFEAAAGETEFEKVRKSANGVVDVVLAVVAVGTASRG